MQAREYNFDGIVGPTHNYAGLSFGNVASSTHKAQTSNPRVAALQGLEKMRANFERGIGQAVLPPPCRPRLDFLRQLGFRGSTKQVIQEVANSNPTMLAVAYSAASMWTANAATVSPSADCDDNKTHLTPANLASTLHRAIESDTTTAILRFVFSNQERFTVHDPLPRSNALSDEGAANHTRLTSEFGSPGIEMFTYGRSALDRSRPAPQLFPARQTFEASQAIARNHRCNVANTIFCQQTPEAIDAGVFHNDVISVGNLNVLLMHEKAFVDQDDFKNDLQTRFSHLNSTALHLLEVPNEILPLQDAVRSYLFNSQLISQLPNQMMLVCPIECQTMPTAQAAIKQIIDGENPVSEAIYLDLRQSMNNGGGPACLRLRVVLTEAEQAVVHPGVIFSLELHEKLGNWITEHYRESLSAEDLANPDLIVEVARAIRELEDILGMPNVLGTQHC